MIRLTSSWSSRRLEMIYRAGIFRNTMHASTSFYNWMHFKVYKRKINSISAGLNANASLVIVSSVTSLKLIKLEWFMISPAAFGLVDTG